MVIAYQERIGHKSHYVALKQSVEGRQASHPNGIAVLTLAPLENRTDGSESIFAEGNKFSGIEQVGEAVTCLTVPASPHVEPSIPKSYFLSAASKILGRDAFLPNSVSDSTLLAPQLVAWWNKLDITAKGKCDLLDIFNLPKGQQDDFFRAISRQATRASLIIQQLRGQPSIWGSWGFASFEERMKYGRSRGCPTNKFGHCHIAFFDGEAQPVEINPHLDQNDQLNHYAPWNQLLIARFGLSLSSMTENLINNFFDGENTCSVDILHSLTRLKNGAEPLEEGLNIVFKQEVALDDAFRIVTHLAGNFENRYQDLADLYENFHKYQRNAETASQVKDIMTVYLAEIGIVDESQQLTNFILNLRPTYEQLLKWETELVQEGQGGGSNAKALKEIRGRYDRIRPRFERIRSNQLATVDLLRDTCKFPNPHLANEFTWPVHSSACYSIDDYVTESGEIFVRGIKLYPAIGSTESVPQIKVGAILRRAIT